MRYNQIRECDIANGEGIGVALFVQGCHFKCKNCFNPETWDFNGGKEWTPEVEDKFIELASRPYIKRISLLGGECLADENLDGVLNLVNKIRLLLPEKTIWLYTGYNAEDFLFYDIPTYNIEDNTIKAIKKFQKNMGITFDNEHMGIKTLTTFRKMIANQCNILVDGHYIDTQRDVSLRWRGSKNQRVIDIQKSLEKNKVILHCE